MSKSDVIDDSLRQMITHMNTELAVTRNNKIMGIIELINDMHLLERTGRGWRLVHEVHNYSITAMGRERQ